MSQNTCTNCHFARWKRTANGRLHPDSIGKCTFRWVPPPMPKALSEGFYSRGITAQDGGFIDRKTPYTDCPTWQAVTAGTTA